MDVSAQVDDERRDLEAVEHQPQARIEGRERQTIRFGHGGGRPDKVVEVRPLDLGQPQRPGYRVDDLIRRLQIAALLQSRVVVEAHAGEHRHLTDLRDEGKVDLIGISTVSAEVVGDALEITPTAEVQNAFSIANRKDQPVLDLCRAHAMAYVPYYPLGSAFTGGPQALADDPAIASVAAKHAVSASQIALAWLLAHYDRVLLIPGTSSVAHLEENLAVGGIDLDDDDLAALDGVTHLGAPGW